MWIYALNSSALKSAQWLYAHGRIMDIMAYNWTSRLTLFRQHVCCVELPPKKKQFNWPIWKIQTCRVSRKLLNKPGAGSGCKICCMGGGKGKRKERIDRMGCEHGLWMDKVSPTFGNVVTPLVNLHACGI